MHAAALQPAASRPIRRFIAMQTSDGSAQTPAQHAKWTEFYASNFTPWDSGAASSQLSWYLSTCIPSPAALPPCPDKTDFDTPAPPAADLYHVCERCAWCKPASASGSASATAPANAPGAYGATASTDGGQTASSEHAAHERHAYSATERPSRHRLDAASCGAAAAPPHSNASTALELGCGSGGACVHLARAEFDVVGVDVAGAAVAAAEAAAAAAGASERCVFLEADALALPAGRFDFEAAAAMRSVMHGVVACSDGGSELPAEGAHAETTCRASAAASFQRSGQSAASTRNASPGFDFLYDCQTYHVLRQEIGVEKVVRQLHGFLRPGGLLFLLTGNDAEPYVGPNVMNAADFAADFPDGMFETLWLHCSRFDATPHYRDVLGMRPLAWWALLRRR